MESQLLSVCAAGDRAYVLFWKREGDLFALADVAIPGASAATEDDRTRLLGDVEAAVPADARRWLSAREALKALEAFEAPADFKQMATADLEAEIAGKMFKG